MYSEITVEETKIKDECTSELSIGSMSSNAITYCIVVVLYHWELLESRHKSMVIGRGFHDSQKFPVQKSRMHTNIW